MTSQPPAAHAGAIGSERDRQKIEAARKGVEFIEDGMVVGLGSGTTATFAIDLLGERVRGGLKIRGIPTSRTSAELAQVYGIPVIGFEDAVSIDVTVDGADEIAVRSGGGFDLIKGGGGKLLHEKIVAAASRKFIIVADELKVVECLGRFPLPVEVIPFAAVPVRRQLEEIGAHPKIRVVADGRPYRTDEGNYLFDCGFAAIEDPPRLAGELKSIAGVVEHGLFLDMASVVVVAGPSGIRTLTR